jgi:hypothetical protein
MNMSNAKSGSPAARAAPHPILPPIVPITDARPEGPKPAEK